MPEYQFANSKGEIITEDYDRSAYFSAEQVLQSLNHAFSLFPYETQIAQVEGYEDVFCVEYPNGEFESVYICGKGTTPGGRQGLKDEQRIQPKAKFLNYVYDKSVQGKKGVFLGVYSKDGQEVLCTWKLMQSNAASIETPISKQIKIDSIAKAIQEGFVQQDKGRGEYACAFKPEFLYFYLKNSDWLHTGTVTELAEHTPPEAESIDEEESEQKVQLVFSSGVQSPFPRNRILFGAPGTGKSYTINQERKKLIGEENETDYERVTFHPDYSYANFVGTYKPVMVEGQADALTDPDTKYVLSVLTDKSRTAQEKYDLLYERFKDEGLTRLPVLLGLYTDESFKTRKQDGSDAAGDNSVEKNHGRAIRKYVNLITGKEKSSDIAYEYVPGPFMRVYVNALKSARSENPKPYLLIIEEINRANVAAVFGDIFQLLDRGDDEVSEYPIQASEDIKKYLAKELDCDPSEVDKIRIPDNMFIWATMNSADQGVFPMDTAFNLLAVLLFLLNDYYENGAYNNTEDIIESNGSGEILWDKTINETFSLLSNNRPYYVDLQTKKRVNDEFDYIKRLHECILTKASKELHDADLLDLFEILGVDLSDEDIDDFGEKDYILYRIENELNIQFNTRKQLVLKTLYAYIAHSGNLYDTDALSMVGTNSFNLVWESVCADIMDNQLNVALGSLPLPVALREGYDRQKKLIDIIEKPLWSATGETASDTLIPDLISISGDQFIIFDAKYYNAVLKPGQTPKGQPGIESVTKQYLYQLAYQKFIDDHAFKEVKNCFLMPTEEKTVIHKGDVSMQMLSALGLQNIKVRFLPADMVFDLYLSSRKMNIGILDL